MSNYFIGYKERSKGFKFYDPTLSNIFEMGSVSLGGEIRLKTLSLKKNWFHFLN